MLSLVLCGINWSATLSRKPGCVEVVRIQLQLTGPLGSVHTVICTPGEQVGLPLSCCQGPQLLLRTSSSMPVRTSSPVSLCGGLSAHLSTGLSLHVCPSPAVLVSPPPSSPSPGGKPRCASLPHECPNGAKPDHTKAEPGQAEQVSSLWARITFPLRATNGRTNSLRLITG